MLFDCVKNQANKLPMKPKQRAINSHLKLSVNWNEKDEIVWENFSNPNKWEVVEAVKAATRQ